MSINTPHLRHSLPWTIGALIVCFAPQVLSKPLWISALIIACAAIRGLALANQRDLLPIWLRTPLGIVCFLAVLYSYGGINGVDPGSALLAVMAAMKLLETRNRRDQFVLLFICLFMMLSTFLQEQSIWSVLYLVVAFLVTLTAWNVVAREGTARPASWYLRQAGLGFALATPLLAAMWILFPRVPGPFWAIPTQSGNANTGLSSTMSPGDISALSESNAVAFRVSFSDAAPRQGDLYWRAIVMQRFDGRSWSADEPTFSSSARLQIEQNGTPTRYRITMEPTQQRWLFALDMPTQWRKDGVYMSGYHTLERRRPVDERLSYNVTSHTEAATALQLSSSAQDWYTRLPSSGNDDARALAAQMREASGSSSDYVNRVLRYFRDEPFYYTLTPPALGRNSVDEFLFRSRRGFCEHYASSFTFMMRAAGIPARIVAGYQGGERNPLSDHWTVRQSDAHAWSEVWLAGRGWTRVDPTAAVAPSRIEQNLESALREFGEFEPGAFELPFMERLQLTWDMINAKWNEWVLGFGPETQRNFFEWLGLSDPDWRDLVIILAILLVSIMAGITLWLAWMHRAPKPDAALAQFQRLQRRLRLPAQIGETPSDYAQRAIAANPAQQREIEAVIWHYLRARYADDARAGGRLKTLLSGIKRN